ncbi:MAG TPA: HEAT repeat domain-containing protein [Myxococcota bacterium]|nr:HEAT repeat domain-containing protein [Myxococcota bacterium]
MDEPSARAGETSRTASDVASLLVELGRALKARRFYPEGDRRLGEILQRGWRALRTELERSGPLELEVCEGSVRFAGASLGRGVLDELARELAARELGRLRFTGAPEAADFAALVEILTVEPDRLARAGGAGRALERRTGGRIAAGAAVRDAREETPAQDAATAREPLPEDELGELAFATDAGETEAEDLELEVLDSEVALEEIELDPEESPFESLLAEFEECEGNAPYARLGERIVELARELARGGSFDEGYRAIVTFCAHAGDERKRNPHHRETATLLLGQLVRGAHLADLIQRASDASPETSLPAAQVLLHRGEPVAGELLHAVHVEPDAGRRERLAGILVSLGERAAQPILEALDGSDPKLARSAVRLAGELQNPRAAARLEQLLVQGPTALRPDAARALARLGAPEAFQALARAVESSTPDVANTAALALAATGEKRALAPLVRSLRRALAKGQVESARELIRALGRLGRAEAAPELAELLRQRSLFQRGRLRELQAAAAAALAKLPGDVAYGALAQAVRSRDERIRRAAQDGLDRRAAPGAPEDAVPGARPAGRADPGRGR